MSDHSVLAKKKNDEGTKLYVIKRYDEALLHFKEAIQLDPRVPRYWNNSSTCCFILGKYRQAWNDAKRSINLDNKYINGYKQFAKCSKVLDDLGYAKIKLEQALKLNPKDKSIEDEINSINELIELDENVQTILKLKNYEEALKNIEQYLYLVPNSKKYVLIKAKCLIHLQKYSDANELVAKVLKNNSEDEEALYIFAMCKFYDGYIVDTFDSLKEIRRKNLDHKKFSDLYNKAKKTMDSLKDIDELLQIDKFPDAYISYKEAIEDMDEENFITKKIIFLKQIEVGSNCPDLTNEIIFDCTTFLKIYRKSVDSKDLQKVLGIRAKCNVDIQEYEDAITDYEELLRIEDNVVYKKLYEETKNHFIDQCNSNYKILKIEESETSKKKIKNSYEELLAMYQSDEYPSQNSESKIKRINVAYKQIIETLYPVNDSFISQNEGRPVPRIKMFHPIEIEELINEQEFIKADRIITRMLNRNPQNEEFIYLQALCSFYGDNIEKSIDTIVKINEKIPNYSKMEELYVRAQKTLEITNKINTAAKIEDMHKLLEEAIKIDPKNLTTNKIFLLQKIEISSNVPALKKDFLSDCTSYITQFGPDLKVLKTRGKIYVQLIEYEDAMNDFKEVLNMEESDENRKMYEEAVKLYEDESKSPAKILRINENETRTEVIKKAFKELLYLYHTDKNPKESKERKKQLERKLIRVRGAFAEIQKTLNIK